MPVCMYPKQNVDEQNLGLYLEMAPRFTKDQDRMLAINFYTWDFQNPVTTLSLIYTYVILKIDFGLGSVVYGLKQRAEKQETWENWVGWQPG